MQQQWTISRSDCDLRWKVDFIQQLVMTSSVLRPKRSSKTLPKARLHEKKKGHGHCLVVHWSTIAFWIPEKPLHLRRMLRKLMRCTKNCNACSQHWPTEWSQFSMTTSDRMSLNQHFKSWMNWATKFYPIHHIHLISRQPTTTSLSTWTTFCRENASATSRRQKLLSKSLSDPKARIFTLVE